MRTNHLNGFVFLSSHYSGTGDKLLQLFKRKIVKVCCGFYGVRVVRRTCPEGLHAAAFVFASVLRGTSETFATPPHQKTSFLKTLPLSSIQLCGTSSGSPICRLFFSEFIFPGVDCTLVVYDRISDL